jgi:hypothetical protein
VIDFYEGCGFDAGLSLDHVVLGFDLNAPLSQEFLPPAWGERQTLTLRLATDFLRRHRERTCHFEPVGVAQGWSPASYAYAVRALQAIGYRRIAVGGLASLKTPEIMAALEAIAEVRDDDAELHLLGVTRCEHVTQFKDYGVTSFDSTSPFRQAFKDDRDNYYAETGVAWVALRVPQVEGNPTLQRQIRAGEIDQARARRLERRALEALIAYDRGATDVGEAVDALGEYELLHDGKRDRTASYRVVLEASPWKHCECAVCSNAGIHTIIFRGSERNKRRGFHNLHVFARRLARGLGPGLQEHDDAALVAS